MVLELFKDQPYMLLVFLWAETGNKKVIKVIIAEVQTSRDLIHDI